MISWYSICLVIVAVLLTLLVIRTSEISTRIQTLQNTTTHLIEDTEALTAEAVTHKELYAILRHSPPYFTMGAHDAHPSLP